MPVVDIMSAFINLKGYAVLACLDPMRIGEIVSVVNSDRKDAIHHPFVVIAETTPAEWIEQSVLSGGDAWLSKHYRYCYRVVTD